MTATAQGDKGASRHGDQAEPVKYEGFAPFPTLLRAAFRACLAHAHRTFHPRRRSGVDLDRPAGIVGQAWRTLGDGRWFRSGAGVLALAPASGLRAFSRPLLGGPLLRR